jgi:hypothetical protein
VASPRATGWVSAWAPAGTISTGRRSARARTISITALPRPITTEARSSTVGDTGAGEGAAGRVAAGGVRGGLVVGAERAEVDDPLHAGGGGVPREGGCERGVVIGVVGAIEGVHQPEDDVDALQGAEAVGAAVEVGGDDGDRRARAGQRAARDEAELDTIASGELPPPPRGR